MITHDIVFHGPRTFDVEIGGAIRHAFTYGARTQRFEVETIGLLSWDDIYGGELEPLFMRLKENKPDGLNIVYILNGGKTMNDGLDDWLLSQMDDYILPKLNMSPTETAGIRLLTTGAEFESAMAFGLKDHEIPLSSRMMLGSNFAIQPAIGNVSLKTLADIMASAVIYLGNRDRIGLDTGITQKILKSVNLDVDDEMDLMSMDSGRLKLFDERQLNHPGKLSLWASLQSSKARMRNSVMAKVSNEIHLISHADTVDTVRADVRIVSKLVCSAAEVDLDVAASGSKGYVGLSTRLSEEVKTGRAVAPDQQITRLYIGQGVQPYLRYYDPERDADLDMETLFSLGEPNETVTLSSIIQSLNTMHLSTSSVLDRYAPVEHMDVSIEPVQTGSGEPSISNIRSITGWDGCIIRVFPSLESEEGTVYRIRWDNAAGIVYGGMLDVTNGVLSIDRTLCYAGADFPPTAITSISTQGDVTRFWLYFAQASTFSHLSETICNQLPNLEDSPFIGDSFGFGVNSLYPHSIWLRMPKTVVGTTKESIQVYLANTPLQFVCYLNEPIYYQLQPTVIKALLGISEFTADCGEVIVQEEAQS